MKKIILAAFALLISFTASAQVQLGVKGGVNISQMSFDKSVLNTSNQAGFYIGPTLRFGLPVFGLGVDLSALYDQRDIDAKGFDELEQEKKHSFSQKQVIVPLNVRFQVGPDLAGVFFYTGPQLAVNVGDKKIKDIDWEFSNQSISWNVGLGAMLFNHLQLNANYNIPLTKTVEGRYELDKSADGKSKTWQIGAAYYF